MKRQLIMVVMLASAVATGEASSVTSGAATLGETDRVTSRAMTVGEAVLRTRLRTAYPSVTQWEVVPLRPGTSAGSAMTGDLSVFVTRVGVRSAVWVAPRTSADRSRGELLWYSVAGFGPAAVSTRSLSRGTVLDVQDGIVASADLVAAGCVPLDSPAGLVGMRTKITIGAGEVICTSAIEARPPVARGDEVTVRYVAGPVVLTTRAVAQSDGLVGKTVLVRNTGSGDFFRATVSGKAEVRVDE
jgi:flagella basal body P-ring formation protein FlgA